MRISPVGLLSLLLGIDGDDNSIIFAGNQAPILLGSLGPASSRDILVIMTFSETVRHNNITLHSTLLCTPGWTVDSIARTYYYLAL